MEEIRCGIGILDKGEETTNVNGTENLMETEEKLKWEEISVDIDWGTIRGKKLGIGSRKILAMHGWLDNADTFDLVAPYIHDKNTIISIDLPGHGKSDHFPPGFIYDIRNFVGAVKKLVTKLELTSFTLLTHSIGAIIGIVYSAVFPEDINTFISVDIIKPWSLKPKAYASALKKFYQIYFLNEEYSQKTPLEYKEDELIKKAILGSKNSLDVNTAKLLLKRSTKPSDCGTKLILTRDLRVKSYFIGFLPFDVWFEFATSIKCPILIIKGTNGHTYETPDDYEIMRNAYKNGSSLYQYFEVEGKHHLHLTNHFAVGPILKNFLDLSRNYCE